MHPALHSWREELPATFVRMLAYLAALALLSMVAARFFQSPPAMSTINPVHRSEWVEIERPYAAFALSIPEAADVTERYAIHRHAEGGGRKDILTLGEPDGPGPYLHVEVYRPGKEIARFAAPDDGIAMSAAMLGPLKRLQAGEPLGSKFGPLATAIFETANSTPRKCLGFARSHDDPRLQLSGFFCQDGEFVQRSTLACAIDRLALLSAGSEPKTGALFAQAELNRSFCGQRDTILAPTPKYHALWKALATRPEQRRIGR